MRTKTTLLLGATLLLGVFGAACTDPNRCKIGDPGCACFAGDICKDGVSCTNGLCTPDCSGALREATCACTSDVQCSGTASCTSGACTPGSCVDYEVVAHAADGYEVTRTVGTDLFQSSFLPTSCHDATGKAMNVGWLAPADGAWVINLDESDVDTYVAVNAGANYGWGEDLCTQPYELACNDDYYLNSSSATSRVRFSAAGGDAYLLSIGTYRPLTASGTYHLKIVPGGPCDESCTTHNDGNCDDGGPDSYGATCTYGTDCRDCGVRPACTPGTDACVCALGGVCDTGLTCDSWSGRCLPNALAADSSTECVLPPPGYVAPAAGACLPSGSICQYTDECCGFDSVNQHASCFNLNSLSNKLGQDVFRCVLDCTVDGLCPNGFSCTDSGALASGDRVCVPDCAR